MNETPTLPWIHIGECPVCVNGLCRVRTCEGNHGSRHFYAMCDECEALWIEPSTESEKSFPDATRPACPICGQDLYGPQSHWSLPQELGGTVWEENAIFDLPSDVGSSDDNVEKAQDSAEHAPPAALDPALRDGLDDVSYGQDEPKPGC
jgi:hypothetical protein